GLSFAIRGPVSWSLLQLGLVSIVLVVDGYATYHTFEILCCQKNRAKMMILDKAANLGRHCCSIPAHHEQLSHSSRSRQPGRLHPMRRHPRTALGHPRWDLKLRLLPT